MAGVVVVGGGIAAEQLAVGLRQRGFEGVVTIVGDDPTFPYQRPPLSKEYLKGERSDPPVSRPRAYFSERGIELALGERATEILPDEGAVVLAAGRRLEYDHLVLATGSRNRRLPQLDGAFQLRQLDEAERLRDAILPRTKVVVVGGGFIGLEVAAAARHRGADVAVVELAEQLMPRAVSPDVASYLRDEHERAGVKVLLGRAVSTLQPGVVILDDGVPLEADLVVAGVGVIPNVELAAGAGLVVGDGIVVDSRLRTSDERISAIGDCASFPCAATGRRIRLESVQNATDQARFVAAQLTGGPTDYAAVPWFWTEQFGHRLQLVGVPEHDDQAVVVGDPTTGEGFSVQRFSGGRLVAVESVNRPAEHLAARRTLASRGPLTLMRESIQ